MRGRDANKGRTDEQGQTRFKKRGPNQDVPSYPKTKYKRGGGPQVYKPTCSNCGKRLAVTSVWFGYEKSYHMVSDCTTIAARGREAKKAPPNGPNVGESKKNHFYHLQAKANLDEGTNKL